MATIAFSQHTSKRTVFIDTCIQYVGNKNKSLCNVINSCLETLKKEGYRFLISEISFYENLHGLWGTKAEKEDALLRTYQYK